MSDTQDRNVPAFLIWAIATVCFIAGLGFGSIAGRVEGYKDAQKDAAKLGLAHWEADPQTGAPVFQWKKD